MQARNRKRGLTGSGPTGLVRAGYTGQGVPGPHDHVPRLYLALLRYGAGHGPHAAVCSHREVPPLPDHHAHPHGIRSYTGSSSRSRTVMARSWLVFVDLRTSALRRVMRHRPPA